MKASCRTPGIKKRKEREGGERDKIEDGWWGKGKKRRRRDEWEGHREKTEREPETDLVPINAPKRSDNIMIPRFLSFFRQKCKKKRYKS